MGYKYVNDKQEIDTTMVNMGWRNNPLTENMGLYIIMGGGGQT